MENRKRNSMLFFLLITASVILLILYLAGAFKTDTLKSSLLKTIVADYGQVILTDLAAGVVESESEVLILSPATTIIDKIVKEPGSFVNTGDIILKLNAEPIQSEIEKLKDQLEMKRNNLEKTQLNSQSTRLDLDYNEDVKKLRITSLKSQLADQKQLLEVGGISPAKIEETKQEITLAEKDLAMMKQKNTIRLKQNSAEEKGLILQIRIDEKALQEKEQLIEKMNITAPSSGIILAILGQEGEKINADKLIVRMSDLTSFKIIGSVEEQNANQIKTGKSVIVNIENEILDGIIGNIMPMVENNKIQFNVHLSENSHPKLISNQKVEIQIINSKLDSVLRIKKIPGIEKRGEARVFVVSGDLAIRKEIQVGLVGNEFCEIVSGLNPGDEILSEDTGNFKHLSEINIKK